MRTACVPYLVDGNGASVPLKRVSFSKAESADSEQEIDEQFLQVLLDRNPSILPVGRLNGEFAPLASLGREIRKIDNLFISPNGRLTVVETKLWRNPQATRQVLSQILEYASFLSGLSYEELESLCQQSSQSRLQPGVSLYQFVASKFPGQVAEEHEFLDSLQRTLRDGRFLLLVVGDGIRENLENILELLHRQSRLNFTFGLVELQIYRQPEGKGKLIVPQLVAHSTEVVRAVVKVGDGVPASISVEIPEDPPGGKIKLTEEEFLESLKNPVDREVAARILDWARKHAEIRPAGSTIGILVPFSTTPNGLVLIRLMKNGSLLLTPPQMRRQLEKARLGNEVVQRIAREVTALVPGLETNETQGLPVVPASRIAPKLEEILQIYTRAIDRLKNLDPNPDSASVELEAGAEDEEEDLET